MNFSFRWRVGSAGFPACGFRGLFRLRGAPKRRSGATAASPRFVSAPGNAELESSVNPQTGLSALRAKRGIFHSRCKTHWLRSSPSVAP